LNGHEHCGHKRNATCRHERGGNENGWQYSDSAISLRG
jgi:hypothetical protein